MSFRVMTFVNIVVSVTLIWSPGVMAAGGKRPAATTAPTTPSGPEGGPGYGKSKEQIMKEMIDAETDPVKKAKLQQQFQDSLFSNFGKSSGSCNSAESDYYEMSQKAADACGEANIQMDCEEGFAKCTNSDMRPSGSSPVSNLMRYKDPYEPLDVRKASREAKRCPIMSQGDIERYETKLKESESKVKELETKETEAIAKRDEAQKNATKEIDAIQAKMADATNAHSREVAELAKGNTGALNAIKAEVFAGHDAINKEEDILRKLDVGKTKANAKFRDAQAQISLNCNSQAGAQVAKMQSVVLSKIENNTYNQGSFTDILRNIGLTDRGKWQGLTQKYYRWCMASKPTAESQDSANSGYKIEVSEGDAEKVTHLTKIEQAQQKLDQLSNNQGCSTPAAQANGTQGPETATCAQLRQYTSERKNLDDAYNTKMTQLTKEGQTATQNGQTEYLSKSKAAAQASLNLANEKRRMDNLQQFMAAKMAANGSAPGEAKLLSGAYNKFKSKLAAADFLVICKEKDGRCEETCKSAKDFLAKVLAPEDPRRTALKLPDTERDTNEAPAAPVADAQTVPPPTTTPPPAARTPAARTAK